MEPCRYCYGGEVLITNDQNKIEEFICTNCGGEGYTPKHPRMSVQTAKPSAIEIAIKTFEEVINDKME